MVRTYSRPSLPSSYEGRCPRSGRRGHALRDGAHDPPSPQRLGYKPRDGVTSPATLGRKSLIALRDLRRARFLGLGRLDVGHNRRVLHLAEVLPRQSLETRGILAAHRGTHGELLGQWIDLLAAAVELVVQVRAGRQAGRADEADHLALAHRDAR